MDPIAVTGEAPSRRDIATTQAAGRARGFLNSASPEVVALFQPPDIPASPDACMKQLA